MNLLAKKALTLAICFYAIPVSFAQISVPPKTPTGFYYPVNSTFNGDTNWQACGSSYYSDTRHNGSDLVFTVGTPVYAVGPGKVIYKSGPTEKSGWGIGNYALVIKHASSNGDFLALYGHIQTTLKVRDSVDWKQQIGTIGPYRETVNGRVKDKTPHLHFGVFPSTGNFPSSNWGRLTDVGCKQPSLTNGFVPPINYIRTNSPASAELTTQPPSPPISSRFDLNGDWIGTGYGTGSNQNKVRIRQVGAQIDAIKLTGTTFVPAGHESSPSMSQVKSRVFC